MLIFELVAAISIAMVISMAWLHEESQRTKAAIAESTGRYLLAVRGATLDLLSEQYAHLAGIDTSGAPPGVYPTPPAWLGPGGDGVRIVTIGDLKAQRQDGSAGYLGSDFPDAPPYGEGVQVQITSSGCPGTGCRVEAFAYTTAAVWGHDRPAPRLAGAALRALEGYGGVSLAVLGDVNRIKGPILDVPNPVPGAEGIIAVQASLDTTLFNQFVRQGDTRHIFLTDALDVRNRISTDTGIVLNTAVAPGGACDTPGMYATTARGSLATCDGAAWFELTGHVIAGIASNLSHGDAVPESNCPSGAEAFVRVALQAVDVTMTGSAVDVRANLSGTVSGSGAVNAAGSVSVTGTFSGTAQSSPASRVTVTQGTSNAGSVIAISDAGPNARAVAMYGCRYS